MNASAVGRPHASPSMPLLSICFPRSICSLCGQHPWVCDNLCDLLILETVRTGFEDFRHQGYGLYSGVTLVRVVGLRESC